MPESSPTLFRRVKMRSGKCSLCRCILTEENSNSSTRKAGSGYCRLCHNVSKLNNFNKNPEKYRYGHLKSEARKNGHTLGISLDQYADMVKDHTCFYCGEDIFLSKKGRGLSGYGLDRIDRMKGYILSNCVTCCISCNERKGRLEQLGFPPERAVELLQEVNEIKKRKGKEVLSGNLNSECVQSGE
jgi:5-methylcytosine-specific restriction endonuclease McrA